MVALWVIRNDLSMHGPEQKKQVVSILIWIQKIEFNRDSTRVSKDDNRQVEWGCGGGGGELSR